MKFKALIYYNLSYYVKSLKFIAPCLIFFVWFAQIHSQIPLQIWNQYFIGVITIFILSHCIGAGIINCEDKTQEAITKLHVKNNTFFHIAKIVSALVFMIPFYFLMIFFPLIFGFFTRNLLFTEIIATIIIFFLSSLMGVTTSVFFNKDFHDKGLALPFQVLVLIVMVVPFATIFDENMFVQFVVLLLPPVNFFAERFHELSNDVFLLDGNFFVFVLYAKAYSSALIGVYIRMTKSLFFTHS